MRSRMAGNRVVFVFLERDDKTLAGVNSHLLHLDLQVFFIKGEGLNREEDAILMFLEFGALLVSSTSSSTRVDVKRSPIAWINSTL